MKANERIPAVSVVMAAYNAEKYLRASIESILGQTFKDFEFIIVEDGSQDATWNIIQEYAAEDPRVRPLRNEQNLRLPRSLNRGIAAARAPWIARHDADDSSSPERLARQLEYLEKHPAVDVLGTQMDIIDEAGCQTGRYEVPTEHSLIAWALLLNRAFAHPSVCIRREKLAAVRGYDPAHGHSEDLDLWVRMAGSARFANLPESLVGYRVLASSLSRASRIERNDEALRVRRQFAGHILGKKVPLEQVVWLTDFMRGLRPLSPSQRRQVAELLRAVFAGMAAKGHFLEDEIGAVRASLDRQLARLASPSRAEVAPGGMGERLRQSLPRPLYLAFMALVHPRVAWLCVRHAVRERRWR